MKPIAFLALLPLLLASLIPQPAFGKGAPPKPVLCDETGRELVPGGYVAITEDRMGTITYTPDDYQRMIRMGANFQVIRTTLGRLGGWPGREADPNYLAQLDDLVRMGKEAGLKTVFKLVTYDIKTFKNAEWDAIYQNTNGTQDKLLQAWKSVWTRYKDEPSVFGYDLLNEPSRGLITDYERSCREQLLPTLRKFADAMHAISPTKWAIYQPLFLNQEDRTATANPFHPMKESLGRDRIIYAPHMYHMDKGLMNRTLDAYAREAELSNAVFMLGEWGPPTMIPADSDPQRQQRYTKVYEATANALDSRSTGAIKAWFCGSRLPITDPTVAEPFTWAIFSDADPVGRVERKFITDAIARPRPLAVAGQLKSYGFDFAKRILKVELKPDLALGSTEIFVSVDRYYPNGFSLELGDGLTFALKPGLAELEVVKADDAAARAQAQLVSWDAASLHLVIKKWAAAPGSLQVKISPLPEKK